MQQNVEVHETESLKRRALEYLKNNPSALSRIRKDIAAGKRSINDAMLILKRKGLVESINLAVRHRGYGHTVKVKEIFLFRSDMKDPSDEDYTWQSNRTLYYMPGNENLLALEIICYFRNKLSRRACYKINNILLPRFPIETQNIVRSYLKGKV